MTSPRPHSVAPVDLGEFAARSHWRVQGPAPDGPLWVTGVAQDSRTVRPGDAYAALPGAHFHGADFAAQAVAAGAVAILTSPQGASRAVATGVPVFLVDDPRAVLGALCAEVYGTATRRPHLIGITGTNGKTTTAYLITGALDALGVTTGLIGTVETRIGARSLRSTRTTPEAPDLHALLAVMVEQGVQTCVMEVSSHALASHRVDGVVYDLAVFTNLSQDHLDFHDDMTSYFEAKAELFTPAHSRRGIVGVDDSWGRRLAEIATVPVETLGVADAHWQIRAGVDQRFVLTHGDEALDLHSALPGDFNVTNTALAAAALRTLGHSGPRVQEGLRADPRVPGRMELIEAGSGPRCIVDYAHTPEAIRSALRALRPSTEGLLICVTGAGGDRDRDKRADMGAAAALADIVIVTDDNPRGEDPASIRAAVRAGALVAATGAEVLEVADRRAAIAQAVARAAGASPRATVAVVGKGHEPGQEIAGVVHPFDDRVVVRETLARLNGEPS